jgi:hypothetical protein
MADVRNHIYRIGQQVTFDPEGILPLRSDRPFTITAKLPPLGSVFQYRIKSIDEIYERVASEHRLTPVASS